MTLITIIGELRRELTDFDHAIHSMERLSAFPGRTGTGIPRGSVEIATEVALPRWRSEMGNCRNCEISGLISKSTLRKSRPGLFQRRRFNNQPRTTERRPRAETPSAPSSARNRHVITTNGTNSGSVFLPASCASRQPRSCSIARFEGTLYRQTVSNVLTGCLTGRDKCRVQTKYK